MGGLKPARKSALWNDRTNLEGKNGTANVLSKPLTVGSTVAIWHKLWHMACEPQQSWSAACMDWEAS